VAEQGITFNISLPMNVSQTPGGHFNVCLLIVRFGQDASTQSIFKQSLASLNI